MNKDSIESITQQGLKNDRFVSTLWVGRASIPVSQHCHDGEALSLLNNFQELKRGGRACTMYVAIAHIFCELLCEYLYVLNSCA